jgi:hypothetical protein
MIMKKRFLLTLALPLLFCLAVGVALKAHNRRVIKPKSSPPTPAFTATTLLSVTADSDQVPTVASPLELEIGEEVASLLSRLATLRNSPASAARFTTAAELLQHLASISGSDAVRELFTEEDEAFRRQLIGPVLSVWADSDPLAALEWFHGESQDEIAALGYQPSRDFYEKTFRALVLEDVNRAARSLPVIEEAENRLAAVATMILTATEVGTVDEVTDALGLGGELRPVEVALSNFLTGDANSYEIWLAKVTDEGERKLLSNWSDAVRLGAKD